MGIKCPNCETITMYTEDKFSGRYISNEGYKIGWDDEFYALCINKDCKLEFLVDTGLGEEEKKFVKCVLAPFHKKWWYVDRFIAGGSLTDRSVIGADFLVHHLEGGLCGLSLNGIINFRLQMHSIYDLKLLSITKRWQLDLSD